MSDSVKKKVTIIRYLLTGTTEILHEAAVEDKARFSLTEHAGELLAKGYEILESDLPQGDFETSLKKKNYTVYLRERVSIVLPNQPKTEGEPVDGLDGLVWPAGLEDFDLTVTRSRHIRYQYEDGKKALPTVSDIIEFERSAMVNHVTGQVTYMPWQALGEAEFAAVETPVLPGYRADHLLIEAVEDLELESSSDQEVVVTFTKEPQFVRLELIDLTSGDVLFSDELKGDAGQVIDYPIEELLNLYKAKGYEVVTNPFEQEQQFGYDHDQVQQLRVEVQAREVLVYDGELPVVGQPVYPDLENSVVWPSGVQASKLHRVVTRTIVNQHEDGQVITTVEQSVEFRRPAKINLLTQEVSYSDWEVVSEQSTFPAYVPEELVGYAPRPRQLPELNLVTADSANLKEVITYTRQIQRVTLRFVDRSQGDMILYQTQLVGRTGEPIRFDHKKKIQEFLNIGYDVIANEFPTDATFAAEATDKKVYTITLEPKTLVVSSKDPKVAGRFIDETAKDGPKWPVGVDEQDLRHLVTRTIHYRYENGQLAAESHVDAIRFERQAELNLVTSQVAYSPWVSDSQTFAEHVVPQVDGYYTTRDSIPGIDEISVTSADFEVVVYYIKTSHQISYTIKDVTTGEELESKLVNGRSVQKLREEIERKIQPYLTKGYQLENKQRLNLALQNPETRALTIELSHQVREVTPDQPQQAGGLLAGFSQVNWPSGLETAQLTKTITRRVRLVYANGDEISGQINQSVTFSRPAQVNLVTKEVTYGDWTAEKPVFPVVELPELAGYLPSLTALDEEPVTADQLDRLVEVIYHPQPASLTVVYALEGSDKELHRDEFSAPVGETFTYLVSERLPLLDLTAYEVVTSDCPEELTFEEEEQTYTVTLSPKTVSVTADAPHQAGTTSLIDAYGLFNWPAGLDKESLVAEVRRVISYKTELGELAKADKVEQVARFERSAIVNLATKEVTYQPWVSEVTSFDSVKSPTIDDLTPDLEEVPALELSASDEVINRVIEVVVTYRQQPYTCQFTFVDSLRQEVLGTVDLTVLDKADTRSAYKELLSTYQQLGYVVAKDQELELDSWKLGEKQVFEISLKPQLMVVTLDHIKDGFASFDDEVASQLQVLEGLSRLDLSREVNRTIKYLYTNGKPVARAYKDSITFKRSARVSLVTGEIFYDEWTSYYPVFDEVLSPVIDDYTPSKEIVPAIDEVTADSQDIIETIIYTRNIQQVVVSVVDKATGNIIYAESITGTNGVTDTSYEVSKFVKKGQEFVSEDYPALATDLEEVSPSQTSGREQAPNENLGDEDLAKPVAQSKPAKKPSVLKQAFVGSKKTEAKDLTISYKDAKLQKEYGLSVSDLARTITREVHFVDVKGQELVSSVSQKVAYQRQAQVAPKTREIKFSDWVAVGETAFPKVTSPDISGYDADRLSLPAYTPNPDGDQLIVEHIIYSSVKNQNVTISFINEANGDEVMNFNFLDKGPDYCEKKLKKGSSFLEYKGYAVVSSDYPDKGQLVSDDTMLYQVMVRQQDQSAKPKKNSDNSEDAAISRKLRESINKKPSIGEAKSVKSYANLEDDADEWLEPADKDGKQKGLFNFLFKD